MTSPGLSARAVFFIELGSIALRKNAFHKELMTLTQEDLERHTRHILLKEIGGPGVAKLQNASVSLIGAGALGGPCALYLAAAGIGQIEVWDDDTVDRSNLQRQVQFEDGQIGGSKADLLAARLRALNPGTETRVHASRFEPGKTPGGDTLIDATDNYPTRFALNALAHRTGRALVHGAAARWTGQASVFASGIDADTPCYQCWVPEEPPEAEHCDTVGVVGPITGMIGTRMALETIKLITGAGPTLMGKLWLFEGLSGDSRTIKLPRDPKCACCGSR